MADAAVQRKNMVESQVRPSDVTDRRITSAMMAIPRERFVPQSLASFAYSDETLTVGAGRTMLAPRVLAKLVQLAEVEAGDKVLVVGSCCGYAAAILAQLAANVVALLPDGDSATATAQALGALDLRNVVTVSGALASGSPAKGPYDVIFVDGGVETVPDALQAQLAEDGRLVAVGDDRRIGRAFLLHRGEGGLITRRDSFQATAPLLSGFEAARAAFVF
jgi:protein-L-isoaspartate(D-aspartate) O-methyltransferase